MKLKLNLTLSVREQSGEGERRVPSTETDRSVLMVTLRIGWKGLANAFLGIFKTTGIKGPSQQNQAKKKKKVISAEQSSITWCAF